MLPKDAIKKTKENKAILDELLKKSDRVFIVVHNRPDMDAVGAAIGMSLICEKKDKKCYIVIDDQNGEKVASKVIEETRDECRYLKSSDLDEMLTDDSLLIALDVNQVERVCVKDYLSRFKNIFIIDHHKTGENTIKTPYAYITEDLSSTCEEVARLMPYYWVKLDRRHANYLLAGIRVDRPGLCFDSDAMHQVVTKLLNKGASTEDVMQMLKDTPEHHNFIRQISGNAVVISNSFAITYDEKMPDRIFNVEDLAKIADDMLNIDAHATFALGYLAPDTVGINARSNGGVNIGLIMEQLGGGGDKTRGAVQLKGYTLADAYNALCKVLMPYRNMELEPIMSLKLTQPKTTD